MRSARHLVPCLALLGAIACSSGSKAPPSQPEPSGKGQGTNATATPQPTKNKGSGPSTAATLGIPPGHLPPVGQCRLWIPGTPPGHQAASRSCKGIEQSAPAGSWILYRPTNDKKVVNVRVVDARKPGVVVQVRVYDVQLGTLISES